MTIVPIHPHCHGWTSGSIAVNVTGANGAAHITIKDANGIQVLFACSPNILTAGWYYCEVTDNNGCYLIDSVLLIDPPEMFVDLTITPPSSLNACDGVAVVDSVHNAIGNYSNIYYGWDPGGPGGIGETVKSDLCNAFYQLEIIDNYGCSITTSFASGSANLVEVEEPKWSIYPNPANNRLKVEFPSLRKRQINIYALSGELLIAGSNLKVNYIAIDISLLADGLYILEVVDKDKSMRQQFIKY